MAGSDTCRHGAGGRHACNKCAICSLRDLCCRHRLYEQLARTARCSLLHVPQALWTHTEMYLQHPATHGRGTGPTAAQISRLTACGAEP